MVALQTTPETKRLRQIMRHIEDVREDCEVLAANLIDRGEFSVGKSLIQHGLVHDASKLDGIEWDHLGVAGDPLHEEAWLHHVQNNSHHPEYWGVDGIHKMDRVCVAEMCCDWCARSSELGTNLREWIKYSAMPRYHFGVADQVGRDIEDLVELLLEHWN
jgi:hypothetical protein